MRVVILGGSGFVGHALATRLIAAGHGVRVLTRRRERHRELLVLPGLDLVEGDVYQSGFLREQLAGFDVAVNLVGILNESGRSGRGFGHAHAELPQCVVEAMRAVGITRLLHMSALNASAQAPSYYLRSKAAGEEVVRRSGLRWTIFRPSVIFGPRDSFVNRFADLLRLMPGVFPLACPDARLQPVYINDVAQAFTHALTDERTVGQSYNLCGPMAYSLREIVARIAGWTGQRVRIVGLGRTLSFAQAQVMEFAPGKPFSLDNYRSLQVDSVCPGPFPAMLGFVPASFEVEVPRFLSTGLAYDRFRASARR
ncbi:MAG: hypothetical protein A2140_08855 [Candidatus Muproteobacteria bacterium RBG_16_62_13]|uniref:NAD-dependent epimerase/dehydratase domain-containing protein n=1 Tax=Candidatus Muproteobacteria bacterium RBG_16_62_13 TaxID=1817756 RepID=A0A1F6T448_9PROT|nr:MAG: hypothetical protein A2140_08855 [Candidatus Muproteobacteria bacterium RBG_16_62_13]